MNHLYTVDDQVYDDSFGKSAYWKNSASNFMGASTTLSSGEPSMKAASQYSKQTMEKLERLKSIFINSAKVKAS